MLSSSVAAAGGPAARDGADRLFALGRGGLGGDDPGVAAPVVAAPVVAAPVVAAAGVAAPVVAAPVPGRVVDVALGPEAARFDAFTDLGAPPARLATWPVPVGRRAAGAGLAWLAAGLARLAVVRVLVVAAATLVPFSVASAPLAARRELAVARAVLVGVGADRGARAGPGERSPGAAGTGAHVSAEPKDRPRRAHARMARRAARIATATSRTIRMGRLRTGRA
jgi:hypothetical protein